MKTQKPNAELVWKQFTDFLIPHFKLSIADRAIYAHLLRHSRLEGKRRLRFSIDWLAEGTRLTATPVRRSVRRLASYGVLRMLERSLKGHLIVVHLPSEILAGSAKPDLKLLASADSCPSAHRRHSRHAATDPRLFDSKPHQQLRAAVYRRDRGRCFYCRRRLNARTRCLDHVIPHVAGGSNTYSNLVSACVECNSTKSGARARDLLLRLHREHRLTSTRLSSRLRALKSLAAGKLRPVLPHSRHNRS